MAERSRAPCPATPTNHAFSSLLCDCERSREEGLFYTRGDKGEGTQFYNDTLDAAASGVFLKLYADDKLVKTENAKPAADKSYTLSGA